MITAQGARGKVASAAPAIHRRDGENAERGQSKATSIKKPGTAPRRDVWALARFLHRKQLPGEKEKNALPREHKAFGLRRFDARS